MPSPARRHFLAEAARQQAQQQNHVDLAALTPYRRLQYQLQQDKAALKLIQSIQDKARAKAEMLPAYADWVQGVLAADNPAADDEILSTVMVWLIDTGALDTVVPLVELAVRHHLTSADDYQRTLPPLLFEQLAEQITAGHRIDADGINRLIDMSLAKADNGSHQIDMPDPVRAKFLKAAGVWQAEFGNKDRAAALLDKAIAYDDRVGAKQLLKEIRAALGKSRAA